MTLMQIYAAYVAPGLLLLVGYAIRIWSSHRTTNAHRIVVDESSSQR